MASKYKKTFTLIEMLIVIVIIGILAAALIPRFQSMQSRTRDLQRKTDLRNIFNALMVYQADNTNFPKPQNTYAYFGCGAGNTGYNYNCIIGSAFDDGARLPNLSAYIYPAPYDPLNVNAEFAYGRPFRTGYYNYYYGNVRTHPYPTTFDLGARLENRSDPDRCGVRNYFIEYPAAALCSANPGAAGMFDAIMLYEYSL